MLRLSLLLSSLLSISAHTFTSCASKSPVTVNSITLSPDTIVSGSNLKITLDANSDAVYSSVSANLVVRAFGVQLLSQSFPIPSLVSGHNSLEVSQAIPSGVPAGLTIDASVNIVTGSTNLACVDLEVQTSASGLRATDSVAFLYEHWTNFHGKEKKDSELSAFRSNHAKVAKNRADFKEGKVTHLLGLNKFAGMSSEEFREKMGLKAIPVDKKNKISNKTTMKVEGNNYIDWVEKGFVTPVKNQGQRGTCYSFSTTGAVESLYWIEHGKEVLLSEEQIIDCSQGSPYNNQADNGGLMTSSFQYIIDHGITSESAYPYGSAASTCKSSKHIPIVSIASYSVVDNSESALLAALQKQPVAVAIDASLLQSYDSGVISASDCSNSLDHGVMLISLKNINGKNAWGVKNSWGSDWAPSQGGYFYLEYGTDVSGCTCGICEMASVPEKSSDYSANQFIAIM